MCSPTYVGKVGQIATFFSAANIILSITAFLGNFLILVALNKESSQHSSSQLLYRCLAASDLLVGLVSQPLYAAYWLSLVHEKWNLCRFVTDAIFITRFTSCGVSMLTMAAISVDRLLALSLGLRYRQIVRPKRMYIITAIFWIASILASSFYNSQIPLLYNKIVILSFSVISFTSYTKILRTLTQPSNCTEHGKIQEGCEQCTVSAVSISCLLCTKFNTVNTCDHLEDLFITFTHHFWNNDSFSVFKVHLKPVPLLLEGWRSETSSETDNQTSLLLSMEL
ncbi:unnamed protein product, partial [Pocillopora meandrina]